MSERDCISTVGELRAALAPHPDNAPILAQVASNDGKAWTMQMHVNPARYFEWTVNPIIVTLSHPNLATLPDGAFTPEAPHADR